MKRLIIIILICSVTSCAISQECQEGINTLPMYGGVKKCKEQIEADNRFLKTIDSQYKDRKTASKKFSELGWSYFYKNDLTTSMKRFNQAWMLDSKNYQSYWGFANILGLKGNYKESIKYFEIALSLNAQNPTLHESFSTSCLQLFFEEKNDTYFSKGVEHLKKSFSIDSSNNKVLAQLVIAYSYLIQKDSAYKYLEIMDRRDKSLIPEEVRKTIQSK